ncbi:hypothetical protein QAD02_021354 [Eretmocerus hayati]|uniref:Uncharacterized protein n=1 Tax=Eretmocerus hayati TaxID=131215 RepID=A0ACC2PRG2_9HYME|nr:hypothetical protein QAD02_021354 [Eretmocerus hayati]
MKKTKTQNRNQKQNVLKNETKKQKNEGNKNEERSRSRSPVTTRDRKSEGSGGSGKSKKGGVRVRECDKQEYKRGKNYGEEHFAKVVGKDSGKEASRSEEAAEKEADEMESEESELDRGRRINERMSRVREELFGCLFAESSKLDRAECREIISEPAKMEELLNGEKRHSATLEGRFDESRRERLHLRNSLAAQTIIERNMREGLCMSGENKGTQAKQGAETPVQAQAPPPPPPGPVTQGKRTKNRGAPASRPPSAPRYALVLKQADGVSDQGALEKVKKCVLENRSVNVKEEIRQRNVPKMAPDTFRDHVRVVTSVPQRRETRKKGMSDEEVSNVVIEVCVGMRK